MIIPKTFITNIFFQIKSNELIIAIKQTPTLINYF
jgi:hypothetical protein